MQAVMICSQPTLIPALLDDQLAVQFAVAVDALDDLNHVLRRHLERIQLVDQLLQFRLIGLVDVDRGEAGLLDASITMFLCDTTTSPISTSPLITMLPARGLITTRASGSFS